MILSILKSVKLLRKWRYGAGVLRNFRTSPKVLKALSHSPNAKLSKSILERYMSLPMPDCKCQAQYIWIDGTGENVRSKTRTLDFIPNEYSELPNWTYDGSSTFQAEGDDSDMFICPCAMYNDPIRKGNNKLVLCETYSPDHKPHCTNNRVSCVEACNQVCDSEPWFGFEQEYHFMDLDQRLYGWPVMMGEPSPPGHYYCGVGADKVYCREIVEAHYRACLYSGVQIFGTNAEVTLSQWEFQIGTGMGVKAADDVWMARFLLQRVAEEYGVPISYNPKIMPNWNGAGMHTNFSSKEMRCDGGMKAMEEAVKKLEKRHQQHLVRYDPKGGEDNKRRLSGHHETSAIDKFSMGIGSRGTSIRIPKPVAEEGKGYMEDRRPASNADPYAVMDMLVRTCLLNEC